uniref:Uncharacterized protein n=1 Tax=Candidatus Kentrum sp. TUN TaxID=2126343 RepID=A0A450ZT42_9GAMM|nr:MAG: hypothetical protein BECKTUN1418D_GA0071000_10566 [Candidatus Kentron sp. TUN]
MLALRAKRLTGGTFKPDTDFSEFLFFRYLKKFERNCRLEILSNLFISRSALRMNQVSRAVYYAAFCIEGPRRGLAGN